MLRSIRKQSGESVQSVLKQKRKAMVGRTCRKGRLVAWNERVTGWWNTGNNNKCKCEQHSDRGGVGIVRAPAAVASIDVQRTSSCQPHYHTADDDDEIFIAERERRTRAILLGLEQLIAATVSSPVIPNLSRCPNNNSMNKTLKYCIITMGGSVGEWLACWTQAQKGPGSNRSRDAVG